MFGIAKQAPSVTVEDVKKALYESSDVTIIDVRTPDEFGRGNIRGSINLPVDDVASKIETIVPDKEKTIYVYCLSGSRSILAVDMMLTLGYTNVFDVKSGLLAWRANQYPLEG